MNPDKQPTHPKTVSLPTKGRPSASKQHVFNRKLHRYVGLACLLFLSILALSGFLLNHPSLLGAPSERTLSFAVDPLDSQHLFRGTHSSLYASDDAGQSWYEVPMLFAAEKAVDIAYAPDNPDHIYVALQDLGLLRSTDGGIVWEQLPLGFVPLAEGIKLQKLGIGTNGHINLWTSGGLLKSPDGGVTWASQSTPFQSGEDLYTIIHQIHTGYYFADWFVYVYDFTAWGVIALSLSGLIIWWRQVKRKRHR